jgi:hypothetical protein
MSSPLASQMNSGNPERPRTQQFRYGGVWYTVRLTEYSPGLHRAIWSCLDCDEEGAWAPVSGEPAQAIELAKQGIEIHHSFVHARGPTRQKPR